MKLRSRLRIQYRRGEISRDPRGARLLLVLLLLILILILILILLVSYIRAAVQSITQVASEYLGGD